FRRQSCAALGLAACAQYPGPIEGREGRAHGRRCGCRQKTPQQPQPRRTNRLNQGRKALPPVNQPSPVKFGERMSTITQPIPVTQDVPAGATELLSLHGDSIEGVTEQLLARAALL